MKCFNSENTGNLYGISLYAMTTDYIGICRIPIDLSTDGLINHINLPLDLLLHPSGPMTPNQARQVFLCNKSSQEDSLLS